jgi:trk system potassium uptake protein
MQLSFFTIPPLFMVIIDKEYLLSYSSTTGFLSTFLGSLILGFILFRTCKPYTFSNSTPFLICTFVWVLFSCIGGFPIYLSTNTPFINALFEGTAGFTTTGTSIFCNIEELPRSILLWRSLMQWLGGIGIIAFFISIQSGVPGLHKLYGAESSKLDIQRPVPGLLNTIRILWFIYIVGTVIMIVLLWIQNVPLFVSINHGLTCISTGGFSTFNNNIKGFQNIPGINLLWVRLTLVIGMLFGSTNFLLHYRFFSGQWKAIFDTHEMKLWVAFMIVTFCILYFMSTGTSSQFLPSTMNHVFQIVSLSSTTGYTITSFSPSSMTDATKLLFFLLMFIGGCHGSTTGGIKMQRVLLIGKSIFRELQKVWLPEEAVLPIVLDKKIVPENATQQALIISSIWVFSLLLGTLLLLLSSTMSLQTAFSAQLSALSNIGPSFMDSATLASSNLLVKIILMVSMIAGRIEILPLLLLFQRKAWT